MTERSTWVDVSTAALEANFRAVATHAVVPVCAVVKANAYGHGLVPVARVFANAGAAMLAVTRVEEARALRDAGVDAPVLILTPVPDVQEAVKLDCAITVGSADDVASLPASARVHLKVDTGMGRLGVRAEEAVDAADAIGRRATLEAVWTHFADGARGQRQLERFERVLTSLRAAGMPVRAHAANSAALLALPGARFDMVRVGTLLYGMDPPGARAPWRHADAFAWYARVIAVRTIPPGGTVGYGSEWRAKEATRVATLPIGYADGFTLEPRARTESVRETAKGSARMLAAMLRPKRSPRAVFFGETRAPVVGRVGMQATSVAVDGSVTVGSVARIPARRLLVDASIERIYT